MTRTNNHKERLEQALSHWHDMPLLEQPTLIKTFTAGLNHHTYLVSSRGKKYVLKLFSKPSHSAISMQKFAAAYHIAPDILYVNQQYDMALLEYVDSETVALPLNPQDLLSLASSLRKLHGLSATSISQQLGDFNLTDFYTTYFSNIDPQDTRVRDLHHQLEPVISSYLEDSTNWSLCHNDLVQENCFILKQGAILIDWEFAQRNNPWFDLAGIIYYFRLDLKQSLIFLNAYQSGWESKVTQTIYYTSQCVVIWTDILWHLARSGTAAWPDQKTKLGDLKRLSLLLGIEL